MRVCWVRGKKALAALKMTKIFVVTVIALVMAIAWANDDGEAPVGAPVTVVVFGHTGNGKSTLCNTLIGDNTGASFRENPNPEEETKITLGKTGSFDGIQVCAIDTPGYGGGARNTAK